MDGRKKEMSVSELVDCYSYTGFQSAEVSRAANLIEKMKAFGENLGMAFQIKDDLLDFDLSNKTGKPAHNDLKDRKFSLPLIYTLKNISFIEKHSLLGILKNHTQSKEKIEHLIRRIREKKGFEYAEARMNEYKNMALRTLADFPDSEYKKSLENLVTFITDRVY